MQLFVVLPLVVLFPLGAQTAFVTGSGYTAPPGYAVAPGQIATFYVGGLSQTAAGLAKTVAVLSTSGVLQSVTVYSSKPINASTLAITVQIPFSAVPNSEPVTIQFAQADAGQTDLCSQNACTATLSLTVVPVLPHIINTCDVFYSAPTTPCQLAITHQNGSLVTNAAPAKGGEVLTVWALGLSVPASEIPAIGNGPIAMNDIILNTAFAETATPAVSLSSATPYLFAGLASPPTGLYQVNFVVPALPAALQSCATSSEWFTGSGNYSISIFRPIVVSSPFTLGYFGFAAATVNLGSSICVAP